MVDYKKVYPTFEVMPELKKFTQLSKAESMFNNELATFQEDSQKRILKTMQALISDELAYVLSVEGYKRNLEVDDDR